MKTLLLVLLVIFIIVPCSDKAEELICNLIKKVTQDKIPAHKVLPIVKIALSVIMLFLGYSMLTNLCLIAIIIQNALLLKKY